MFKRFLPFLLLLFVVAGCDKNKLETKPTITLKNMNGTEFPRDPVTAQIPDLYITVEYNDKEGDLGGGIITYIRDRLNVEPITDPGTNNRADTVRSTIPDFPKTTTGDIEVKVSGRDFLQEDPNINDTMIFKVFVQDVAGNSSDTIVSPIVVQSKG
jgi:hypothetical protein